MKNKKTVITITSILAVLLVIIGVTYAYWLVTKTQTNQNIISAGCLDISLSGEKNDITLTNQFPMSDEDGMKLVPYEFTVTNNCTTSVDYQVNLESIGDSANAIKTNAVKVALNNNIRLLTEGGNTETTLSEAYESNMILYGTLAGSSDVTTEDTVTYELRIWIDANAPISEQNKEFRSKISVTIGQGIINPYKEGTLAYDILSNYGEKSAISELTDFSAEVTGIYKADDDLGTSYYFRGAPTNNYVKLGKLDTDIYLLGSNDVGTSLEYCRAYVDAMMDEFETCVPDALAGDPMYWRIVRINGDGTIRLSYDGLRVSTAGNQFNQESLYEFYNHYLKVNYEDYIADGIFCDDKTLGKQGVFASVERVYNLAPTLKCSNKADRFTTTEALGNGQLSAPIGTLTTDEALMISVTSNDLGYFSFNHCESTDNDMFNYCLLGQSSTNPVKVLTYAEPQYGDIIPVINLKADVKFTGDGSYETPYEIVIE